MTAHDGPFHVVKHWRRWSIEDVLDWNKKQPVYDTEHEAQAEADRRNAAYARKHAPRPRQPDLFSSQETS